MKLSTIVYAKLKINYGIQKAIKYKIFAFTEFLSTKYRIV